MAVTGCDEQEVAAAARTKGGATVALFAGELTVIPEGVVAVLVPVLMAVVTLMATFVTHEAPAFPHALTCNVCSPEDVLTFVLMAVA